MKPYKYKVTPEIKQSPTWLTKSTLFPLRGGVLTLGIMDKDSVASWDMLGQLMAIFGYS